MKYNTCVIFGVFDGIHEGHFYLIDEAKKSANKLVAIVTPDEIVKELKHKLPKYNEKERLNFLRGIPSIDDATLGDDTNGTYSILKKINPDLVFLGYDQIELFNDLNEKIDSGELKGIKIIIGKSYHPEKFHSSILNK